MLFALPTGKSDNKLVNKAAARSCSMTGKFN